MKKMPKAKVNESIIVNIIQRLYFDNRCVVTIAVLKTQLKQL